MRPELAKILTKERVDQLRFGKTDSPQRILGRHFVSGGQVVSVFHPNAQRARLVFYDGENYEMENIEHTNIFSVYVPHRKEKPYEIEYTFEYDHVVRQKDPYVFSVHLKRRQLRMWETGTWKHCYRSLGAHSTIFEGVEGVSFVVWAPNAARVSVVGDFNCWDGRLHPMIKRNAGGIFELFLPDVKSGMKYKYEIQTKTGEIFLKADPFATAFEVAPSNASVIYNIEEFVWTDREWMVQKQKENIFRKPIILYEIHLGSWRRGGNFGEQYLSYETFAEELTEYMLAMGYTHVELMGVMEHLQDESVGRNVYGFYAPTSRFGNGAGLQYLINKLHENNIGVILDWAPLNVTQDESGIFNFDGTALFERKKKQDQCMIFDYHKKQVTNYMMSNVLYWMREFHIDGFRILVGKKELEESQQKFLHKVTQFMQKKDALVITEELPDCGTHKIYSTFQWSKQRMGPLVNHISKNGYQERSIENLEDNRFENVNSRGHRIIKAAPLMERHKDTSYQRMPGDSFAKFANLRTLYGFMIGMQGKKHFFMGQDFAQMNTWNLHQSLDWHLLEESNHRIFLHYVQDLLKFYKEHGTLYETDCRKEAMKWLSRKGESEIETFMRFHPETKEELIFICNFTPMDYAAYKIGVENDGCYQQVFSSDEVEYGGIGTLKNDRIMTKEEDWNGSAHTITLQLPKQSMIVLKKGE